MELLFIGLTALLCAPLLEKKKEPPATPSKPTCEVTVIVIEKEPAKGKGDK